MRNRTLAALTVAAILSLHATGATAQEAVQLRLGAQPLEAALREVGAQTNINVFFDPALVSGLKAPTLNGRLTTDEALTFLLAGTGLQHEFLNERTVAIRTRPQTQKISATTSAATEETGEARQPLRRLAFLDSGAAEQSSASSAGATTPAPTAHTVEAPMLGEVVVTARKKTETLIEVPMNITAIGSVEIADRNVVEPADLYRTIAGAAAPEGQLILRGLSGGNSSNPNTTSTFTDGVPGSFGNSLFDVARVEVLRGPQGTLWGSNAIGGTVQVITNAPEFNVLDVFGSLQAASEKNRNDLSTRLYAGINLPLIDDTLALRIVGHSGNASKKTINTYNGFTGSDKDELIRSKLRWQATEDLSLTLGFIHDKSTATGRTSSDQSIQTGYAAANWYGVPGVSATDLGYMTLSFEPDPDGLYGYGAAVYGWVPCEQGQIRAECRATTNVAGNYNRRFAYWDLVEPRSSNTTNVTTLNVDYDIGDAVSVNYVGSFQRFQGNNIHSYSQLDFLDIFPSPYKAHYKNKTVSHELRVSSAGDNAWDWTVGGYSYKWSRDRTIGADTQWLPDNDFARAAAAELWGEDLSAVYGVGIYNDPTLIWLFSTLGGNFQKERAMFGETNYVFDLGGAGELELTGGLRYYELSYGEDREEVGHFGSFEDHYRSPVERGLRKKVSLSWRPHQELSVYALYSEGYRPGGANVKLTPSCERDPLAADFRLNYKSDKIDNYELGVKGAAFNRRTVFTAAVYNIDWTDVRVGISIPAGCGFTANAGLARSRGVEFESTTRLLSDLSLTLNASYTNSEYRAPVASLGVEAGEDMTQVPKYNFYMALQQGYSIFNKEAFARLGVAGYGKYKSHFKAAPGDISDSYVTADVSTTLNVNDSVRFGLHVDNFLNKEYTTYQQSAAAGAWPDMEYRTVSYGRERTITLRADFNF
ncbi:TonB-dependent receptor domain-containing protein [Steroidobacter sp.]|uniref:TonB-dependent receptor domain-containing protein n=1 Tax=Steroidobacter sp. TaxID=1978227 RepID=UPI001A636A9E|nr:TonB-dependent receptor [Steroidobacter sp.]MBL8267604.1 TonB-dependent receptor [Steroidobacter sp.]